MVSLCMRILFCKHQGTTGVDILTAERFSRTSLSRHCTQPALGLPTARSRALADALEPESPVDVWLSTAKMCQHASSIVYNSVDPCGTHILGTLPPVSG